MEAIPLAKIPAVRPPFPRPPFPQIARPEPRPQPVQSPRPYVRAPGRGSAPVPAQARPGGARGAAAGPRSAGAAPRAAVAGHRGARSAGAAREFRPRPQQEPDQLIPTAIIVTGYPPYTKPQDLAHVFCQFGDVRLNYDWITDTGACLEFSTPDQAKAAIGASRSVNLYGAFLTVRPCTVQTRPQKQRRQREHRVKQNFKGVTVEPSSISLEGSFGQQLDALLSAVKLSPPELERLSALYRDIELALRSVWPGCRAFPFGSVTTGLGVKSSDADCFVALPDLTLAPGAVPRAKRALQLHPHVFTELLAIPRANTPIVKFLHIPTNFYCDLSFKTSLGSRNSKLISFLLFSDPRLIPMALVVKYWARVHDLTGTGKLTNYALTMLIIFYLQQRSLLPPVEWLQRDQADACYVDYWNTGFMSDHRLLPRTNNSSSVAELLGGFFEFYSTFDFDQYVVCPFLGRPVKKDDFRDLVLLSDEFALYKINVSGSFSMPMRFMTAVCVQDPFEQCHNVASAISTRLAADICAFFKFAADAYEKERSNGCTNLLRTILLEKPILPHHKVPKCRFTVRVPPNLVGNIASADWKAVVRDIVLQIFEDMLKIDLEKEEIEQPQVEKAAKSNRKKVATEGKENANPERETAKVVGKVTTKDGQATVKPEGKEAAKSKRKEIAKLEEPASQPVGKDTVKVEEQNTEKEYALPEVKEALKLEGQDIGKLEGQDSGKPKAKKVALPKGKEAIKEKGQNAGKLKEKEAAMSEVKETAKLDAEETLKLEENGANNAEENETDKPEAKEKAQSEAKAAAKSDKKGRAKRTGGITSKEKEKYLAEITRAIWKRKQFSKLYSVMGLTFPDREAMITDEITKIDKNVINFRFHVILTLINAPRGASIAIKHYSGDLNHFKEFGKFFTSTFHNWCVMLSKPYCKEADNNKKDLVMDINTDKLEEDSETDSDTDSYEDERINPNANSETKSHKTESLNESVIMQNFIDKCNKNKSNNAVKKQSENDKTKCDTNKTCDNVNMVDKKNDKDGNPSDKSPQKKNRSPRHKKGKDKTNNGAEDTTDSEKTLGTVKNGQMP